MWPFVRHVYRAVAVGGYLDAYLDELSVTARQVVQPHVLDLDVAAGGRGRDHERRRLDAVGDDAILAAVELLDAVDLDARASRAP